MRLASEISQKSSGKTVIAHISDLHFRADTPTNDSDLQALENSLRTTNPDLLVVTGDLIDGYIGDWLWLKDNLIKQALSKVRNYVESLCRYVGLDPQKSLFVIPGNHDYRIQGLLIKSAMPDWFDVEFGKYSEFGLFPKLNTVIFAFDSNSSDSGLNLATGLIRRERFTEFEKAVDVLRVERKAKWYECTKIALLHHHPMPIGSTEERVTITDRDEFLLLRNAGTFMEQMARAEIDLVLHGHKHYPSLSKVIFPKVGTKEHSIAVIAAGSVRNPPGNFHRSFNIITIHGTGEIELERRVFKTVFYETLDILPICTYEEARNSRYYDLIKRCNARVKADKYVRRDWIEDGSGDIEMHEEFRGVRAIGEEPVPAVLHQVTSLSARFGDRSYLGITPGQSIRWKWLTEQDTSGKRTAETTFIPPLGQEPIDFDRTGTMYNAIHFSRENRLDVTGQMSGTEDVSITVRQAYGTMALQVIFPEDQWPTDFNLAVNNELGEPDIREMQYSAQFFTVISPAHSVILLLSRPLVGYTYKIEWSLPEKDETEILKNAADAGTAEELIQRLLAARNPASPYHTSLGVAMGRLSILAQSLLPSSQAGNTNLEITIYCYDPSKRGLVCVAAQGFSGIDKDMWTAVIKPGERIDGQAFKRRESMLFINVPGATSNSAYYVPPTAVPMHTVICSIPLFYPLGTGRRVAVVSFATRSNTSGLFKLQSDETCLLELVEELNAWLAVDGATALDLKLYEPD